MWSRQPWEWGADARWAVLTFVPWGRWVAAVMSAFGTVHLLLAAATFSALQRQELLVLFCRWCRQGCSGSRAVWLWLHLCLVSALLAGLHVGLREAEDLPWKMFNFRPLMFNSNLTPQTVAADWGNLQKMDLSSADVHWHYLLDLADFIHGSCFTQEWW